MHYFVSFLVLQSSWRGRESWLLLLSCRCFVTMEVMWLFVAVPWVDLQCVVVLFPDHTHLLYETHETVIFYILLIVGNEWYSSSCFSVIFRIPSMHWHEMNTIHTVKPVLSGHSQEDQKWVFNTNYRLMQVKCIAECSKGSILQYFRPALSYHMALRPFFAYF